MDPYLERFWNDVHGKLLTYIADDLNESLPPRFRATVQERVGRFPIDYDEPCDPPLQGEDAAWARALLDARSKP